MAQSKDQDDDRVAAKAASLTKELAKTTGVKVADVEKVMKALGLETALAHRQYIDGVMARFGAKSARRLNDVRVDDIRAAVGVVPI